MTSHTHVQLSNSKAYITIRNAKAVKDTHTVTHSHTHSSYEQQSALTSHFSHCQDWKYQLLTLRRNSHILVSKKNRGEHRLLTNGAGSNVSREDPLRSTNWAEGGQPTVFPTFPQCSAVQCSVSSPQTAPRPPWLRSQGCGLPVHHAKLSLALVLAPSSEL